MEPRGVGSSRSDSMTGEHPGLRDNLGLQAGGSQAPVAEEAPETPHPAVPTARVDGRVSHTTLLGHLSRSRVALAGVALTVFAIFLPALIVPYAFADDYPVLALANGLSAGRPVIGSEIPGGFFGTNIIETVAGSGRPVAGILDDIVYMATGSVDNLRFVRLLSVLGIVAFAFLLHFALVRVGVRRVPAAIIAVAACGMPSFEIYGSWAVLFNVPWAALLGGCASLFAVNAVEGGRDRRLDRMVGAVALMLLALLIYQPAAMFLWVFLAVALYGAAKDVRRAWHLIAAHGVAAACALLIAYVALKTHYAGTVTLNPRDELTTDIGGKIHWFFSDALYQALNLGNVQPVLWLALLVAAVIVVGLPLLLRRRTRHVLLFSVFAAAIVPLTYLPNLVVRDNLAYYRTELALTTLVVLYVCAGAAGIWFEIRDWLQMRTTGATLRRATGIAAVAAVAAVAVSSALAARNVLTYVVLPQSSELSLLRSQVRALPPGVQRVGFLGTPYNLGISHVVRYDEFGLPSTAHPFVGPPAILQLLHEQGRLGPPPDPTVEILAFGQPTNEPVVNVFPGLEQLR